MTFLLIWIKPTIYFWAQQNKQQQNNHKFYMKIVINFHEKNVIFTVVKPKINCMGVLT